MLPDWKGEKITEKFRTCINYDDVSAGEGLYNTLYGKSVYKVEFPSGKKEQLTDKISQGTIWLSQFYQTQYPQLAGTKRYSSVCTWVYLPPTLKEY